MAKIIKTIIGTTLVLGTFVATPIAVNFGIRTEPNKVIVEENVEKNLHFEPFYTSEQSTYIKEIEEISIIQKPFANSVTKASVEIKVTFKAEAPQDVTFRTLTHQQFLNVQEERYWQPSQETWLYHTPEWNNEKTIATFSIDTQQYAWERFLIESTAFEVRQDLDFQTESYRHTPGFKYNLEKSKGNNNKNNSDFDWARRETAKYKEDTEWDPVDRGMPTASGKYDLVIDFREPWIHDNSHIGKGSVLPAGEYYDIRDWLVEPNLDYEVTWTTSASFYTDIWMMETEPWINAVREWSNNDHKGVVPFAHLSHNQVDHKNGIYSTKPDLTNGESPLVIENGYISIRTNEIIDVPEGYAAVAKHEYGLSGHELMIEQDLNGDGNFTGVDETITLKVHEASAQMNIPGWGEKRFSDSGQPGIINWNAGKSYLYFTKFPPLTIVLMILGFIVLVALIISIFFLIGKKEDKRKRREGLVAFFKNPLLWIKDEN